MARATQEGKSGAVVSIRSHKTKRTADKATAGVHGEVCREKKRKKQKSRH